VLLDELQKASGTVARKLDAQSAVAKFDGEKGAYDEKNFRWAFNEDQMATEKLSEGIRLFAADALKLEKFLGEKLDQRTK
jgi:transaldolase